jgi:hypothetical protein
MSSLAQAFAEEAERRKDATWVDRLGDIIGQAVWPFKLGLARVWIDEGYIWDTERTIKIDLERLPNFPFAFKFDERSMYQAYDPHAYMLESMSKPLFNHFRYRPCLPVEDHIILGEE